MITGYKEALLSRKKIHEWMFSACSKDVREYILSFVTERERKDFLASCSTYSKPSTSTPPLREETHEEVKESNSVRTYQLLDPRYLDYPTPERRSRRSAPRVRSKRQNKRRNQLSIAKRRDHKLESGSNYDEIMLESDDEYIMESSVKEEWDDDYDWYNDRDWLRDLF